MEAKRKGPSRKAVIIVTLISVGLIVPIAISAAVSGGSSPDALPTAPGMQLVGKLRCDNLDSAGKRTCRGTVVNNSADAIQNPGVILKWQGDDRLFGGTIETVPLLPHQQSKFTIVTDRSNPSLQNYEIAFSGG